MDKKETSRILAYITAVYPGFIKDRDPQVLNDLWQRIFRDTPFGAVEEAVFSFIASDTKGFPPTPGAVNAFIVRRAELSEPTESEAWALVLKAVSRGCYNSREEFEKLPPEIREVVGHPRMIHEWSQMSPSEVHTVICADFKRAWRARQQKRREIGLLYSAPALPGEDS